MIDLSKELNNFNYREIEVPLSDIFPNIDIVELRDQFAYYKDADPHKTIFNVAKVLWEKNLYGEVMHVSGFWDTKHSTFSGLPHQCVPILGAVLKAIGFEVSYLEGLRIRNHFFKTGSIDPVFPVEIDDERKDEFISMKRIPSSCLEVEIKGHFFYISPENLRPSDDGVISLLTPDCYADYVGVFRHQSDANKSGIYIKPIIPKHNLEKANFSRRIVWSKQELKQVEPELFATFLRLQLAP